MILSSGCEAPQLIHMYPYQSLLSQPHIACITYTIHTRILYAYMACLRSRVLTDSCSQRRYQRQSICQAWLSNPFLQSEIEQQIIWHIVASQSRPLFPEILRYGAGGGGACQLHEPSQSYVMRLVSAVSEHKNAAWHPLTTTTTTELETGELATWRWRRPHRFQAARTEFWHGTLYWILYSI